MYIKFTFDAEKKEAGEYLWAIMRKYNVDPAENTPRRASNCSRCFRNWTATTRPSSAESDTRFDQLISHINELIKYYRLYVVPKKGSSKSEDEDDSQDGGTEDNGIGSSEDGDSQDVTPATPEPIPENGGGDNGGASIPGNGEGGEG